jgi:hypothetical protein
MIREGVIKFQVDHEDRLLVPRRVESLVCKLVAWREILSLTGLVGQDPGLYEGASYGNVSARVGPPSAGWGRRAFLITGSQTAGTRCISLNEFAVVERYDYRRNCVASYGKIQPSSESMTHGAVYDLGSNIRCVLHVHSPVLWSRARQLKLPTTDPAASYGTPAMALEVQRLYRETLLPERAILAMGGHEDGIVVFGRSPEVAGQTLLTWLARAYEIRCQEGDLRLSSS